MSIAKIKFSGKQLEEEVKVDVASGTVELNGLSYELKKLSLGAPISGSIYGTLLNYSGVVEAMESTFYELPYNKPPQGPVLYIKPINTVIGYGVPIPLPEDVSELEVGAALGVVMGKSATRVREDQALDYVAGYTVVNDVSIPHSSVYRPAIKQKARDGFCPVGPWVIDKDAVTDPNALEISVFVNGELRQQNTTANLIRPVSRLISEITDFMTLQSGDVLLVGVPECAPLVKAGDHIRIEISGVGSLENQVVHETVLALGGSKL